MEYPNLKEEKKLWEKGFKRVVCLDEAGRGPLAGPVVAAAVMIQNTKYKIQNTKIRDSKKLSQQQRKKIYRSIIKDLDIEWGLGRVSEKVIDKINILEATKLAMIRAIQNLEKKLQRKQSSYISHGRRKYTIVDFLILDGNFKIDLPPHQNFWCGGEPIPQKSIVKADEKVFSCAAASILAKVTRDRIMERHHKKYPRYGFNQHKGYPTRKHFKMLKKYGPCKKHRKSFKPVSESLPDE